MFHIKIKEKSGSDRLAAYGLERSNRDKGNTKSVSDSMLTYRRAESEVH